MELLGGLCVVAVVAVPLVLWLLMRAGNKQIAAQEQQNALRYFEHYEERKDLCAWTTTVDFATMTLVMEQTWFEPGLDEATLTYVVRRNGDGTWEQKPTWETWRHLIKERRQMSSYSDEEVAPRLANLGQKPTWGPTGDQLAAVEPHYQRFLLHWRGQV